MTGVVLEVRAATAAMAAVAEVRVATADGKVEAKETAAGAAEEAAEEDWEVVRDKRQHFPYP